MRKDRIIYFVIFALLLIFFLLTGRPAFAIAMAVVLVYLLFAVLIRLLSGTGLKAELNVQKESAKGEPVEAELILKNRSMIPVMRCDVSVHMKNLLTHSEAEKTYTCSILPMNQKEIPLVLSAAYCGMIRVSAENIRSSDPLRLFSGKIVERKAEDEVLVLPELASVPLTRQQVEQFDMESFRYADGRVGSDSSETVGIRSYEPGDSIKAIHWKLSAKTGETVIKEYGYPVDAKVMLLLEKGLSDPRRTEKDMDLLTGYGLSVSLSLAEIEVVHTLGWYDASKDAFVCREIREKDDIYRILPEFLRAPFTEEESACIRFLGSEYETSYAAYLYVSQKGRIDRKGLDLLGGYANVTLLAPEGDKTNNGPDR